MTIKRERIMRKKLTTAAVTLGLTALGLAIPTTAQAADGCNAKWPGRDGYVRAWDGYDCQGELLGASVGNDRSWGDVEGDFQDQDYNRASSVMNSGFIGGKDVVAFYWIFGMSGDYACLSPNEFFVDNLSRNKFTNGENMDNSVGSHRWVTASECAAGTWMS
jgi:hypothetical protein